MKTFLRLPIRFETFFQKQAFATCPINHSIASNLHLLITTALGENKSDLEYGSQIWEHDFDIHLSSDTRREIIINSLRKQMANYEKRLSNIFIEVYVRQLEVVNGKDRQIKRRVEIVVNGSIKRSNEPFKFQTGFFIAPLTFD